MPEKNANNPSGPAARKYFYMLLGVVALAFAFMLGYSMAGKQSSQLAQTGKDSAAYQQAVSDVKQKLQDSGFFMSLGEVKTVSGTITSVGEDFIEINAYPLTSNPLEEPTPTKRHVTIGPDTKILKTEPLSAADQEKAMKKFAEEQKSFQADVSAGKQTAPPMPPSMESTVEIELADLTKDSVVAVSAANDIARSESFTATEIKFAAGSVVSAGGPIGAPPAAPNAPGIPTGAGAPLGAGVPPVPPPVLPPPPPPPPPIPPTPPTP